MNKIKYILNDIKDFIKYKIYEWTDLKKYFNYTVANTLILALMLYSIVVKKFDMFAIFVILLFLVELIKEYNSGHWRGNIRKEIKEEAKKILQEGGENV